MVALRVCPLSLGQVTSFLLLLGTMTAVGHGALSTYLYDGDSAAHDLVLEYTGEGSPGDFLESNKPRFVEFYSPYCGHCRSFKSIYLRVSNEVKQTRPDITFYAVSCAAHNEICRKYKVGAYPSFFLFNHENPEGKQFSRGGTGVSAEALIDLFATSAPGSLVNADSESKLGSGKDMSDTDEVALRISQETIERLKLLHETGRDANGEELSEDQIKRVARIYTRIIEAKKNEQNRDADETVEKGAEAAEANLNNLDRFKERLSAEQKTGGNVLSEQLSKAKSSVIRKRYMGINTEKDLILDTTLSFIHSLAFLFKTDGPLSPAEKQAFEDWLDLLRVTLPQEWTIHTLIDDLLDNTDSVAVGYEYLERFTKKYAFSQTRWSKSCEGGNEIGGGFTCGFWKLLHVVTVGIAEYKGGIVTLETKTARADSRIFSPSEAADIMKEFIVNFFPCTECAEHFAKRYDDCSYRRCIRLRDSIQGNSDADWKEIANWLWEFHNEVSIRLLHEKGGVDGQQAGSEVAAIWPSFHECVTCIKDDGSWNEKEIFLFIEKAYWVASRAKKRGALLSRFHSQSDHAYMSIFLIITAIILTILTRRGLFGNRLKRISRGYNHSKET